ncbi:MAG: hypothetical protein GC157_01160 [Frankiales bacterium]|nr:hypothetical protein [Frankiales bacterium]
MRRPTTTTASAPALPPPPPLTPADVATARGSILRAAFDAATRYRAAHPGAPVDGSVARTLAQDFARDHGRVS